MEPEFERVRVQGRLDDKAFKTGVVVTPASVYIGNSKIDLDLEAQMTRFRRNIDARHETVELSLRCSSSCGRVAKTEPRSAETSR